MNSTTLVRQPAHLALESFSYRGVWADVYAARGWPVFPVIPGEKRPLTQHGFKEATCDIETVHNWWARWPSANIGLATGQVSGIYVLDVDSAEADEVLLDLQRKNGPLPTACVKTSKGWHLFFRRFGSPLGNTAGRLAAGLDTRGDGGYVILPPSEHPSGHIYSWHNPGTPITELPQWLVDLWNPPKVERPPSQPIKVTDKYVLAAVEGEIESVRSAPEGTRNDALNSASYSLGSFVGAGVLDEAEIQRSLISAALASGLPEREALNTVRSGLTAGKSKPRQVRRER